MIAGTEPYLLGLDPSTTKTGYAVMRGPSRLIDAGVIYPPDQKATPVRRTLCMVEDVRGIIAEYSPSDVVVEIPNNRTHARFEGIKSISQSVYPIAVGAMCLAASDVEQTVLREADVREWTRGVSKKKRQATVAAEFPAYAKIMDQDGGGDASDAIGVCLWWYMMRAR